MTRDEWKGAQPILTQALFLPLPEQKATIESAFIGEALRRELLEVLARASVVLPTLGLSRSGAGTTDATRSVSGSSTWETNPRPLLDAGQSLADGRFVVVRQLGRGGMGEVYLAHDKTLGNLVALKVLYDAELREAQHARLCSGHPHIVTMHDVFEIAVSDRARTVLVMEYVAGRAANGVVDDGPADLREAVRWAREVTAALAHAHDRGVLHCDLKPANILITPEKDAKVLDFGIGRATFERANPSEPLRGTVAYMAPEQLLERRFSQAGDVYSLGVTLFELVTGRLPFEGSTPELILQIVGAEPPLASELRSQVPKGLDEILTRTLAKEPDSRYRSVRALDRALAALEWDLTSITSPVPAPVVVPIPPPPRPGPWTYVGRAAQTLTILTALGFVSSTALDSGLERTSPFRSETPLSWPLWGAMSLTAPLLLTAAGALVLAILTPLLRPLARIPGGFGAALRAARTRMAAMPTNVLAQALLALNVMGLVAFLVYYQDLLDALRSFTSGGPGADITALGPQNSATHNSYRQVMTILLAIFGFAWYRLLRRRRELGERDGLPTLFGGALAIGVSLLLNVMPHRVIYLNKSEQVSYGKQTCFLVGRSGDDALLFCPLDRARNRRVDLNDPALLRSGEIDDIFRPLGSVGAVTADP